MPPSPPTACPLVERVGVRGASTLPQVSRRFRAAAAARVTSPLLVHARAGARANGEAGPKGGGHGCPESRRSNQEETTPRLALAGLLPGKSVRRGRAFRAGSCPREKASPSMASPAARPCRPRLTPAEGPHKSRCASCAPEATARAKAGRCKRVVSLPCLQGRAGVGCSCRCFCAQERAASPGPPMARRVGGGKSAGWPAGMRASFPPAHGGAVGKPRNPPAHP